MEGKICRGCENEKSLDSFHNGSGLYGKQSRCKECQAESAKAWRQDNKEHIKAYNKSWNATNSEYAKQQSKAWHEQHAEQDKKYYQDHPEKFSANKHKRKARLKEIIGSFTSEEWEFLLRLCNFSCARCGTHQNDMVAKMNKDHIVPISVPGATNFIANIQPLCESCNKSKQNREAIDY